MVETEAGGVSRMALVFPDCTQRLRQEAQEEKPNTSHIPPTSLNEPTTL